MRWAITVIDPSHYFYSSFTLLLFILHITSIDPSYYFYSSCILLLFILYITFIHPARYFYSSCTLLLFSLHITFILPSHYFYSSCTLLLFILHITFIHPAHYFYSSCTLLLFILHSASAILNLAYVKEHLASFISDTESFRSGRPRKDDAPTEAKDLQSPSKNGWVDREHKLLNCQSGGKSGHL